MYSLGSQHCEKELWERGPPQFSSETASNPTLCAIYAIDMHVSGHGAADMDMISATDFPSVVPDLPGNHQAAFCCTLYDCTLINGVVASDILGLT